MLGVLIDVLKEVEAINYTIPFHLFLIFFTQDPVLFSPIEYFSGCIYHLSNVLLEEIKR